MDCVMNDLIRHIRRHSIRRKGELAAELVVVRSEEKEAVLAELEFEQWRCDCCEWLMAIR